MSRVELKQKMQQHLVESADQSLEGLPAAMVRQTLGLIAQEMTAAGLVLPPEDVDWAIQHILQDIATFGPLHVLLHDGQVTEIMVNGPDHVFVEREGQREMSGVRFASEAALRRMVEALIALEPGKRLDGSVPYADVAGPDGARINLAIPPVVVGGPHVTIRKFRGELRDLDDLVALQTLDDRMAIFLDAAVRSRLNILFTGASGTGKTTLLEQLARRIPDDERIVVIEDTLELQFDQPNVVRLQTRSANVEGRGEISMRDLLRNALRMSADRILLGEVRGAEAHEYLQALSSGHRGSLAILHAASPAEALVRLENLARYTGFDIPPSSLRRQIALGIDVVVQLEHLADGSRKVTRISEVLRSESLHGDVDVRDLFRFEADGMKDGEIVGRFVATHDLEGFRRHFQQYGLDDDAPAHDPAHEGARRKLTDVLGPTPSV